MRIEPPPSVPTWSGPRPAAAAAEAPPLEPPRLRPRQRDEGVELRVEPLDAIEDGVQHLDRRDLLLPDQHRQLGRRRPAEPLVGHVEASRHAPRRRGSRTSRRASPRRFEPNTARLIATPGKSTRCGAFCAYSVAETESIRPHEG